MKKSYVAAAAGAVAIGALTAETINLYKEVMGRNDRVQMPIQKYYTNKMTDWSDYNEWVKPLNEWADNAPQEEFTIQSDRGEKLKGYYWPPENNEKPEVIVVGVHGYHSSHKGDPYSFLKHYHDRGYVFFACDHTATSSSEGKYVGFDYFESMDLRKWIDFLSEKFGEDVKFILHGVSMGASTVMKLAGPSCPKQVIMIIEDCGYTSAKDEFIYIAQSNGIKKPEPIYKAMNQLNKRLAGYDFAETDVREEVKNASVPILFIHGDADDFVPTKMAYELYELCPEEKRTLKIIEGAPHASSVMIQTEEFYKAIDSFIDENL